MTIIQTPMPVFVDVDGSPLESGYVYIGTANLNPETSPLAVYWDSAMLQPAAQPLRTSGGMIVRNGTPAVVHVTGNYSVTVRDGRGAIVYSFPDSSNFDNDVALSAQIVAINATLADISNAVDMAKGVSMVGGAGRVIASIAVLKTLPKTGATSAYVLGYYSAGDGGGGAYYYDAADVTTADNGGTVIVANDGGRWKLAETGTVSAAQFGIIGNGVDYTARIQVAVNTLVGQELWFPAGFYTISNMITISDTIKIRGCGPVNKAAGMLAPPTGTTVFRVTFNTGVAANVFYVYDAAHTKDFSVEFEDLEFSCTYQPAPGAGWAPVTTPWAICFKRDAYVPGPVKCSVNEVMIRNFTHGIYASSDSLLIDGLYTQCFDKTLHLDGCYDAPHIRRIHDFVYWSGDANVRAYQLANKQFITMGRVDNPVFSDIFCYTSKAGVTLEQSGVGIVPSGGVSRCYMSNVGFDDVGYAVYVNCGAYAGEISIVGGYTYLSGLATSTSYGVVVTAPTTGDIRISLNDFDITGAGLSAIELQNATSKAWLSNVTVRSYNLGALNFTAFKAAAGSMFYGHGNVYVDTSAGGGLDAMNNWTRFSGNIYTPSVTRGSGTVSVTASPMTYTAGTTTEYIHIHGGTVIGIALDGVYPAGIDLVLLPRQQVLITYTVAPTITKNVI